EGFILNTMGRDAGAVLETARQGKPVVLVDRLHDGLDVDFVSLDNQQAITLSGRHLLDAGYRALLLVTEPLGTVSSRIERARAFKAFVAEQGPSVSGRSVESKAETPELLDQALRALRETSQAMPAVITSNAVVTLRVVEAVARLGWRLGRDIGLVGIDDTPWAPYVGPGVTAVSQPTGELGRLAAQCLMQRLAGSVVAARKILLPGTLVARGSTTP